MQPTLLTVRYRWSGEPARFAADMANAAAAIAAVPGLAWKIWGFDAASGTGLSAYLFETPAAADVFAAGPIIERLKGHPKVADVALAKAAVERDLSLVTGAGPALATRAAPAAS